MSIELSTRNDESKEKTALAEIFLEKEKCASGRVASAFGRQAALLGATKLLCVASDTLNRGKSVIITTMRTVLITGASDGIGKAIALALSKQKENLILFGRNEEKLHAVKAEAQSNGAAVTTYVFDLTDNQKRQAVIDEILANGQVDVLVNNAGVWHKVGDITTLDETKIADVINTNLTSQILLTRQLLSSMRSRENTAIINIVSKSGLVPQFGQTAYTASKYGLKGFTDVLREDTKDEPIRVGAVYQSGTNTEMFAKAGDDFPTEKFTDPNDLAGVVVFMLTRPKKIWLNEVHVVY